MNNALRLVLAAGAAVVWTAAAHAGVTLNSVRVVGKDSEALGKFYAAAFGLMETNRLATPNGPELFLNFGATAEAAKANTSPAAVKAAGGTVNREPTPFANTGIVIALVADPEGNHIELIQPAQR